MSELLKQIRALVEAKLAERQTLVNERKIRQDALDEIVARCATEKRDLSSTEATAFDGLRGELADFDEKRSALDVELEGLQARQTAIAEAEEAKAAAEKAAERWAAPAGGENANAGAPAVRVGQEPRTYTRDSERRGTSFFRDVFQARFNGSPDAQQRLDRHQREARVHELAGMEERAVGTGAFAGLTVPQYLTDLVAPAARAMAPTVGICNRHPLPDSGMTLNISRITTGTSAAAQATENSAVSETNADDTLLTVNVRTFAGQQTVSRQALERGTGVDSILAQDLANAYWTKVDASILNDDGTSGTHLSIRSVATSNVTYTDASPTVAELYPKLAQTIATIQSAVFMGADYFVMTPKRWWWLASSVGTSFPFLQNPSNPNTVQAGQIGGTEYLANNRFILGVPVVVDGNMLETLGAGTEDVILAVTSRELHFWEEANAPLFIRAEQTAAATLGVLFVAYSYSAFAAGRYPGAHGIVSGTGLIAPTF